MPSSSYLSFVFLFFFRVFSVIRYCTLHAHCSRNSTFCLFLDSCRKNVVQPWEEKCVTCIWIGKLLKYFFFDNGIHVVTFLYYFQCFVLESVF